VGPASDLDVINASLSTNGKGLTMIELEKMALLTAPPSLVNERALSAITREDFSPHGSRHVPRTMLCLAQWIRILQLSRSRQVFLARLVQAAFSALARRCLTLGRVVFRRLGFHGLTLE